MRIRPRWPGGWSTRRPWARLLQVLAAVVALLLGACNAPAARMPPTAVPSTAALPTPTLVLSPPTVVVSTPTPDPAAPRRVGLQVGHWRIEEHPDEQAPLRKFSGAYYRGYDEWELNIVIAQQVKERLETVGVVVELIPATVPIGYQADAFVSIHVDGVTGAQAETRRGWKLATPFRASAASRALAAAISETYPRITGLPDDPHGPSYDMRAYYAFAYYRYWHSIAPITPAVIVETGFMTHPADRELLFNRSNLIAEGIAQGVLHYLERYDPADVAAREPVGRSMLRPVAAEVPLFTRADVRSAVQLILTPDQRLAPMAAIDGWVLVFTHGGAWDLGWVRTRDVQETGEPLLPPDPWPTAGAEGTLKDDLVGVDLVETGPR